MSISEYKLTRLRRIVNVYLLTAAFCLLFSLVYEYFSHGVWSAFMAALCLWPLILGVLPFSLFQRRGILPGRAARTLWHCGVATLTTGSAVAGVLEIYGTTSVYTPVYFVLGLLLLVPGAALFIAGRKTASDCAQHDDMVLSNRDPVAR